MTDNNFNFTLIDTRGLKEPAVLLIQKISNACGMVYADLVHKEQYPHDRVRAGGNEQSVQNSSDDSDLFKRALAWDEAKKIRKYENINKILSLAAAEISSKASEDKIRQMDDDKINYIMEKAAMVSDAAMQYVWAKLVSGEAENPGKFSRQAVNIVSIMDEKDADKFTKVGQFVTDSTPSLKRALLIYDVLNDVYKNQGINHGVLSHLQSLGLIHVWIEGHSLTLPKPQALFCYGDSCVEVSPLIASPEQYVLRAGEASLTPAGIEILSLAEPKRNPEFWKYIIEVWEKSNVIPIIKK